MYRSDSVSCLLYACFEFVAFRVTSWFVLMGYLKANHEMTRTLTNVAAWSNVKRIEGGKILIGITRKTFAPFLLSSLFLLLTLTVFANSDSAATRTSEPEQDGQHDFDFEFGSWKAHILRLQKPLTGSKTWLEYNGSSVVRKIWNGRANLGELDVSGSQGRIEGMSLRTYNPQSRQWYISWVNSADGMMGPPMIGGFKNGRGEFYNQEPFNGRAIYVRFIFSEITANAFQIEQAFSDDGGKTWEANWIAKFSRVKE